MPSPDFQCHPVLGAPAAADVNDTGAYPAAHQERIDAVTEPTRRRAAASRLAAKERVLQVNHGEGAIQAGEQARGGHLPVLRSRGRDDDDRPAPGQHFYKLQHPERIAAHGAVATALSTGKLARPLFCMRCFRIRKVEAHHDDYSKPLEVRWLCRACHCYIHPRTQKNASLKPTYSWQMTASADEMADAMARARMEVRS